MTVSLLTLMVVAAVLAAKWCQSGARMKRSPA
jgi:hypothetical protein